MNDSAMEGVAPLRGTPLGRDEANVLSASAISWGAIIAGATGAAALSLILLILGTGLGLSAVSPWASQGVSATTFGASTIVWLAVTQIAASGMGGYLAGRLRTPWTETHTDEVYFRDTAHGFLAWAVATIVTAAMLTSAIGSILSGGAQAGASIAGNATTAATTATVAAAPSMANAAKSMGASSNEGGYFVDSLFRKDPGAAAPSSSASASTSTSGSTGDANGTPAAEAGRIYENGMASGSLSSDDAKYVGQMIAQRTGMSQPDAEKRAVDTFSRMQAKAKESAAAAQDAVDKARKAAAHSALWFFVSLLIGAFCASLAATYGGRRRDMF